MCPSQYIVRKYNTFCETPTLLTRKHALRVDEKRSFRIDARCGRLGAVRPCPSSSFSLVLPVSSAHPACRGLVSLCLAGVVRDRSRST